MASDQTRLTRLKSEDVIVNAPMSFAGAAQRSFRLRRKITVPVLGTVVAVLVVVIWWLVVVVWYVLFGLVLLPYRILRRGARKRKKEALRHREMLTAIEAQKQAQASPPEAPPAPEG